MDAATASDSVAYKPEVGEVAGSSPTSRSMLFLLFILSSLFFLSSSVSSPSGFWQFLLLVNMIYLFFYFFRQAAFGSFFLIREGDLIGLLQSTYREKSESDQSMMRTSSLDRKVSSGRSR